MGFDPARARCGGGQQAEEIMIGDDSDPNFFGAIIQAILQALFG